MRRLMCLCLAFMCSAVVAAEPDFSVLNASITLSGVIGALFSVGAVLVGLYLAQLGIREVIKLVNRPGRPPDQFDFLDDYSHMDRYKPSGRKIDTDDTPF